MEIEYRQIDSLPRLGWCARMERGDTTVRIQHGPWVETRDDFFVAGAWDGAFSRAAFDSAITFLGSGGRVDCRGILFSTACHTLERLYLAREEDGLALSNSLAFLFAAIEDSFDPDYRYYNKDLTSVKLGLKRVCRRIPTRRGRTIRLVHFTNLLIRPDLSVDERRRPYPPEFHDYDHYREFLSSTIRKVCMNARSSERQVNYEPLATISSGYDSPACASLVKSAAGCEEAVTIRRARSTFEERGDSGAEIAQFLGLSVQEFEANAYMSRDDFPEAEFLCSGGSGGEVVMTAFESRLPGRLLCTGYLGDTVWGVDPVFSDSARSRDLHPAGPHRFSVEFGLRTGFIHFPIPQSHQGSRHSLLRITRSRELAPWNRDSGYERPIARRILQEAGVPEDLFGQSKKAVTQPLHSPERLRRFMSPHSWSDFQEWTERTRSPGFLERTRHELYRRMHDFNVRVNWRFQGDPRLPMIDLLSRPLIPHRYSADLSEADFTFHWGMEKMILRYRAGLPEPTSRGLRFRRSHA